MTENENTYVYQIAQHMKETAERIEKELDANTDKTEAILIQATKTNGRVNGLEGFSDETKKTIAILVKAVEQNKDSIRTLYIRSITAIVVASACLATIGYFFQANIKYYNERLIESQQEELIDKKVEQAILNYDKITIND